MRESNQTSPRRISRAGVAAIVFILVIVAVAIAAPLVSPYSPTSQPDIVGLRAHPPMWTHPFGTDLASRDLLARVIYGARTSLSVALLAVLLAATLGMAYGMIAGYAGGTADAIMMRLLDGIIAIPRMLLLIVLLSYWNRSAAALIVG